MELFFLSPPLVKAATGEEVTAEELGGAEVHTVHSGVADSISAEDEDHALRMVRNIVENLPDNSEKNLSKRLLKRTFS